MDDRIYIRINWRPVKNQDVLKNTKAKKQNMVRRGELYENC